MTKTVTTYRTARPAPQAALLIRIRRAASGPWLPCPLLVTAGAWVQVDDGQGPLWVMVDHIHPGDRATLAALDRLELSRN